MKKEPVDVSGHGDLAWDEALKPRSLDPHGREPFDAWWSRHGARFPNLDSRVLEQWVHRHWGLSPYRNLLIERISSREESWPTDKILREVVNYAARHLNPSWDLSTFNGKDFEPGATMDRTGTWDMPMLILEHLHGFLGPKGSRSDARYWLIEGHQRFRYLNALAHFQKPLAQSHAVLILSIRPEQT